ncbi:hypothetical protein SLEP1_g13306 [Rubroshorea leprosula]|uniref:COX assembly mitochondrial protein n=1 Tax=Rubroshorea leprosula TaxID=152421 RepID=A0AAV5IPH4_9ROSI|nr:hypothetical protein SLEP1_g13306 [Rubroshorea leprosula]
MFTAMRSSKIGVAIGEEGLLKLVHPGRFVEIHKRPIVAAEVMRKNPRYCIARPYVFDNPWIVGLPLPQAYSSERECYHQQSNRERFYRQYQDESLVEVITRHEHTYQEFRKKSLRDSTVAISSPHKDCNSIKAVSTRVEEHNVLVNKCRNEATRLKSCLRKHDCARRLLYLRVSFSLPVQDEE